MKKILYWNIEKFSINKINDPSTKRKNRKNPSGKVASGDRSNLILSVMRANMPDIFVVIETTTGAGAEGTLITAGGGQAALDLLQKIRTAFGNTWMLVPPLIIGQNKLIEGVCVYYNSNSQLFFTGPFGWQGGVNPANPVAGGTVAYAAPWDTALPTAATPTTAGIINPGLPQNQLAGQWLYDDGATPPVQLEFPSAGERPPYLITFWDASSNRNIKLVAYHAPPPETLISAAGTNSLTQIREITTLLTAQDDVIIMGDFNVNLSDGVLAGQAYNTLTGTDQYTRQINPTANAGFPDQGYICTTIYGISGPNKAEPTNTRGYPAYGYMTQNSYDNMLTRYGNVVRVPVASNVTIVNLVTGSPYNKATTPPYTGPQGTLVYNSAMETDRTAADPLAPVALLLPPYPTPNGNGGYATPLAAGIGPKFREWDNYGVVRSTSDHMALIIDF